MLQRAPAILVVEDEPFIALDVAMAVEDAGGKVIGPAASIAEALKPLESSAPHGAILDVNLPDGDITPVVEYLVFKSVPFIIQTGVGLPGPLSTRFPDLVVMIKPVMAAVLVGRLAGLIDANENQSLTAIK